jgi:hypothetical protein
VSCRRRLISVFQGEVWHWLVRETIFEIVVMLCLCHLPVKGLLMDEDQSSQSRSDISSEIRRDTICDSLSLFPSKDILSRLAPSVALLIAESVLSVLIRGSSCGRCFASCVSSSTGGATVAPSDSGTRLATF